MPYTGLTVDSTTNGVDFITTAKTGLTATITDEVLQISGTGARLNGAINITRSQVSVFNSISGGAGRGQGAAIAYVNSDAVTDTANIVAINQSSLSFESTSSIVYRLLISRIVDSIVTETGLKNLLYIYTQPNSILSNSRITSIAWLELAGSVSQFANVSLINTKVGVLNYEAGRIDLVGINIPSTTSGYSSALGEGNSGNNIFVFWNPVFLDFTKLLLMADNCRAQLGYTISWKIQDSAPTNDALIVYRDDRSNIGGAKTELARYTTDSGGTLSGTYDSKLSVAGSNISRPTLWVLASRTRLTGNSIVQAPSVVPTSYQVGGANATKEYVIDPVSSEIEIRSYLHFAVATITNPTLQVGAINSNETVKDFLPFILTIDTGITQTNRITAAAVAAIAHTASTITISASKSIAEIYDSRKAYWRDNGGGAGQKIGTTADFKNLNITIAATAAISPSNAKFSDGMQTAGTITLTDARAYNGIYFSLASGGSVVVSIGNTDLRTWTFAVGSTINVSSGIAIVTVAADQIANITAGAGVTVQSPLVFVSAPNFAQNTRVQIARLEPYSVASTSINTATNIITISGNRFKSASPATLVYFQLQAGATLPTTTPQIAKNTLYFVQAAGVADALTAGQFKLSLTQGGAAIVFSTQGSGNFTLTGITELDNSLAGASGYSVAFAEPNNTLLRVSAQFWQNATGCTATNFYQQNIIWDSTSGNAIADTVSIGATPDTIHNSLIGNSTKVFGSSVTLPSDGSTVAGISFNAQGVINLDPRSFALVAGFPTLTPQAAYLYTVYYRSTATGIRVIANQFSAQDAANFVFSGLTLDNIADGIRNTPNTAATIAGGFVATSNGSNPIKAGSGAIYLNADTRGVAISTTSGATISPTQQQIRDALTLSTSATLVVGSIDSKLALIPITDNAANVTAIKTQTDKFVFTTANRVDSTAIGVPLNPLITSDARLNNLDATISSRATQSSVNAIPINPLLTSDTRLNNLDATISSRLASAGYATPPTVAAITSAVWANTVRELTGSANIVLAKGVGITGLNDITAQSVLSVPTSSQITAGTIGKLFADNINAPIAAIPSNPLLTTDTRLNNLDASIASRATQSSVDAIPNNSTAIGAIKVQTDKFVFTTIGRVDSTAIGVPTNPLITTDGRLNNLDASIASRATQSSVNAIPINPLLTTDGRLNFIDASISANAPANVWSFTTRSLTTPFPSVPSSTDNAIAIRTNLAIELARVDASIASRSSSSAIVAIDSKLDEIKTNTAGGDYVVL